ncbi:hypothetical protein SDC9_192141 [bioreactor metagenome]|uniref:Uncharacterized protein n=1 Tax=bioreactor metagenome TaxID=1076179 RepID=A0A645I147_9ZZZZ
MRHILAADVLRGHIGFGVAGHGFDLVQGIVQLFRRHTHGHRGGRDLIAIGVVGLVAVRGDGEPTQVSGQFHNI